MAHTPQSKQVELNSKYFLTVGAFVVFVLVFFIGLLAGNELTIVLRNAAISAVIGAILTKICLHIIESNIEKTRNERERIFLKDHKPDASEEILKLARETSNRSTEPEKTA
ncbi:MAG: hypothetical protein COZ46_05350 [Verrucomicrobia bacterium CG_4_10_14_3_um_filter_43_23]|nr:MAG: hypothetical protein AUJ82_08240 [Verrucomicrobia bacterium CG1_02_43_26]PIP59940.1 MAG: hypothetical protein COX01_00920 [Verrucomicrobia bacterium CG22_combo_CG10-13_8_21_14_all_43_17]PIX58150.1 MAG: hypothetical protein COZ46_05350 [Verrucomicrobia bacterium CG_4_10_14_3_um_filter_43_23]PIY61851.1 MAG: hypothetical protein COY94_03355 [Verrucomicrobia bacterium CG_4_10_14_0_8_um_filter_43_34]PJA44472.1 MAG: hypothetical protein CO175_02820 [Verrucomicrobia bacterium CG_4_9_14_3_um_fi